MGLCLVTLSFVTYKSPKIKQRPLAPQHQHHHNHAGISLPVSLHAGYDVLLTNSRIQLASSHYHPTACSLPILQVSLPKLTIYRTQARIACHARQSFCTLRFCVLWVQIYNTRSYSCWIFFSYTFEELSCSCALLAGSRLPLMVTKQSECSVLQHGST